MDQEASEKGDNEDQKATKLMSGSFTSMPKTKPTNENIVPNERW